MPFTSAQLRDVFGVGETVNLMALDFLDRLWEIVNRGDGGEVREVTDNSNLIIEVLCLSTRSN